MDAMVLLEGGRLRELYRTFAAKQRTMGRGLTQGEFLDCFLRYAAVLPGQGVVVTKLLMDLFRQIDVNGDNTLEWSEFVSFCVEAGSVASLVKIQRPTFFLLYDTKWEDTVSRCTDMRLLQYVRNMDVLVSVEAKSDAVHFWSSGLRLLRRLRIGAALRGSAGWSSGTEAGSTVPLRVAIIPDGKMVAVLLSNHDVGIWLVGLHSFVYLATLKPPVRPAADAMGSCGGGGRRWGGGSATGVERQQLPPPPAQVATIAPVAVTYDPTTKLLLLGCSNGTLMAYDVRTLRYRWSVRGQTDIILDLVPLPHKGLVASTSLDGTVALWDADRQRATRGFKPPAPVDKLLPVPQLDLLVGKCCMNVVLGWDLALGEQCFLIDAHTAPIADIALLESAPPRLVTMDSAAIFKVRG
jgi:hypothetical protein